MINSTTGGKKMKRLLCFIIILSMLLSLVIFNVSAKEYSYDEMADFLSKLDILHGDASKGGDYDYYSYLTRAQFAKIAVAASKYKNSVPIGTNTSPYSDVTRNHWAAGYIKVAATNGIVTGYPDSTFRPEATVLLEEAVTIALKLLGYENSDFGGEWPYGQMGIANNIGLLDNVTATVGAPMTRLDAIALMYNALNEDTKSGSSYLQSIGYQLVEEVVLVASSYQDSGIDSDKVVTSNGTYKVSDKFDFTDIGSKGDILLKNNKEIVGFFNDGKEKETYVIMGALGDDIIVSLNGKSEILDLTADTEAYYNNAKTTASSLTTRVKAGDSISVVKDNDNKIKYVVVENQTMDGPIKVASSDFLNSISMSENNVIVIKGGMVVSANEVAVNDIIYYSKALNTVWVYSDKRVGIFEEAIPNQETPTSVVISGVTYELESAEAFSQFSSTGNVKLGQAVTVLLGKDGKIADIATTGTNTDTIYGYLYETGTKEYTLNNEKYSSHYATIVLPDGSSNQYETGKEYKNYIGQVVKLTFNNSKGELSLTNTGGASGQFSYSTLRFGELKIAANVNILDVKANDTYETGDYMKIYPPRINGVTIRSNDVLYVGKNAKGEVSELILKDVTGDNYQYGIILEATSSGRGNSSMGSGSTTYLTNGSQKTEGTYFTASKHTFAKLDMRNNRLDGFSVLNKVDKITELTNTYVKDGYGTKYTLSDSLQVYTVDYNGDYILSTLTDAVENADKYTINAYYDKTDSSGGRIRILTIKNR